MKLLILILLLFPFCAGATNYYVSANGSDANNGNTRATSWHSISKVNSSMHLFAPGDSILFKRGDNFYGSLAFTKSGIKGHALVVGAYGTGAKPVLSGFITATGWKNIGGNLWQSSEITAAYKPKMVTIGGVNTAMGRYPNATDPLSGYLILEAASGDTSITDNQLTNTPNWTGATVVIRSYDYVLKADSITKHSGSTIKYVGGQGGSNPGKGYFIENAVLTLDQQNEWYFNNKIKALIIYSAKAPVNVKVATIDTIINTKIYNFITIRDLAIEGANCSGVGINTGGLSTVTTNITVKNCDISFSGKDALYGTHTDNFLADSNTVKYNNNNGIYLENEGGVCKGATVTNNKVISTGLLAGMISDGTNCQGITLFSATALIQNNYIDSVGYIGIAFYYNNTKVKGNLIKNYGSIKQDGAGIYTFNAGGTTGREVTDNIVINGIGAPDGTGGLQRSIMGIYMDDNVEGVLVARNSINGAGYAGIYLHNNKNIMVRDNLVYNAAVAQVLFVHDRYGAQIKNVDFLNNKLISAGGVPQVIVQSINDDIDSLGLRDSNIYVNNAANKFLTTKKVNGSNVNNTYNALSDWKTSTSQLRTARDAHAKEYTMPSANIRFEYNAGNTPAVINFGGVYKDASQQVFSGSITLQPHTAAVLFKQAQ